ncbi:tRNA:m(4)X modification enzyme TRM13 homolog [Malaya genurostris]|uniref:tRNA:m(4)X modification enzyme TRM13 homolog n=1 Tax=Malaya genurostris TaxID=325434 RepID=UPI0026F3F1E5|nr:tRNA:m(4)X modification enzyme TRM13 homolog [Malaya genurostris]
MNLPEEPADKRSKMTTSVPDCDEPREEVRCKYFLQRKKRLCKMTVGRGKFYCGEHEVIATDDDGFSTSNPDRIPCPLDPKHSVSSMKLEKHLRVCNARVKDQPDYIQPGINSTSDNECDAGGEKSINSCKLADVPLEDLKFLIGKIGEIYETDSRISSLEQLLLEHAFFKEQLTDKSYGPMTLKHVIQLASLLGIIEHEHFLQSDTAFVEFGAGKGQVTFALASIIQQSSELTNSKVLLIDRASHRHKQENRIEDRKIVHRIRADIADLELSKLNMLQSSKRVIGIGKHLCGAATDLALRCLVRSNHELPPNKGEECRSEGFVFALCCHNRCDWRSYTGKKFLLSKGIDQSEFDRMVRMTSWAVCGSGTSREKRKLTDADDCVKYGFTRTEREDIGRKCKRVLDLGRLDYLEQNGFSAQLKFYAKSEITLENVCLIGHLK